MKLVFLVAMTAYFDFFQELCVRKTMCSFIVYKSKNSIGWQKPLHLLITLHTILTWIIFEGTCLYSSIKDNMQYGTMIIYLLL